MKTEKEKLPVEPEAQPLKEEELNDVNGGAIAMYSNQFVARGERRCKFCGKDLMSPEALKAHKEICPQNPKNLQ